MTEVKKKVAKKQDPSGLASLGDLLELLREKGVQHFTQGDLSLSFNETILKRDYLETKYPEDLKQTKAAFNQNSNDLDEDLLYHSSRGV